VEVLGYYTIKMKGLTVTLRSILEMKLSKMDETLNPVAYVACHKGCNGAELGFVEFSV
jgi:hypothetical protein